MGQRRQSRELALQVLFQQEFGGGVEVQRSLDVFKTNFDVTPETWHYAELLSKGVLDKRVEIDALIQGQSAHWSLKRMSLVDLNIMRIAVFELQFGDRSVPPAVCIDEAIEISKKYSGVDASSFVNGILDQIMRASI